jgi:hypothetical protein
MTPESIINEVKINASEWLEMAENPDALVSGILAKKIVDLNFYIEYLKARIEHVGVN